MTYLTAVGWTGPKWSDPPPPVRRRQRVRREPRLRRRLRGEQVIQIVSEVNHAQKAGPRMSELDWSWPGRGITQP